MIGIETWWATGTLTTAQRVAEVTKIDVGDNNNEERCYNYNGYNARGGDNNGDSVEISDYNIYGGNNNAVGGGNTNDNAEGGGGDDDDVPTHGGGNENAVGAGNNNDVVEAGGDDNDDVSARP